MQSPAQPLQISQLPQLSIAMAHKSEMAEHAAYFAMKETNKDIKAAHQLYDKWMPEEPVSKWKPFAERCWERFSRPDTLLSRKLGGRPPLVSRELALKIGTVYAQRLVWEHGKARHYRNMDEVRSMQLLPAAPAAGTQPSTPLAC